MRSVLQRRSLGGHCGRAACLGGRARAFVPRRLSRSRGEVQKGLFMQRRSGDGCGEKAVEEKRGRSERKTVQLWQGSLKRVPCKTLWTYFGIGNVRAVAGERSERQMKGGQEDGSEE